MQAQSGLWPDCVSASRLVRRLAGLHLGTAFLLLALAASPFGGELRTGGLGGVAVAAVVLALAGLLATVPVVAARVRFSTGGPVASGARRWPIGLGRLGARLAAGEPRSAGERLARLGRRPQGVIVPALAVGAVAVIWALRPSGGAVAPGALVLGGGAIVLAFPLLVAERIMGDTPRARLPEAAGLQALLFLPVASLFLGGQLEIGAGLGFGWARTGFLGLDVLLALVAAELGVRALANWFLPPPAPMMARAAVTSLVALLLQPGRVLRHGVAAPIRTHLGIDFSRSWGLRTMRSAALPIGLGLGLAAWVLTGVTLIDLDQRGVYERLGRPVAVWAPGAHVGLPWPLGRVRPVEFGVVHAVLLAGEAAPEDRVGAQDPAPASADRLWDRVHPSEVSYLIASLDTSGAQGFQTVSVDLKVLYRTGLDDAAARASAYMIEGPDALVRAEAGRLLAGVFAGTQLADVLGADREAMAARLQGRLQAALDRFAGGIEVVGVVIEAIHPPLGAAEAYHNVQAAEIVANTAIATERGRAQAAAAMARQTSIGLVDGARGAAADTVGAAEAALRTFTADRFAAQLGRESFLLERYLANVSTALAKSPLVIVDHRLGGADAPVIDLRSFAPPAGRPADDD